MSAAGPLPFVIGAVVVLSVVLFVGITLRPSVPDSPAPVVAEIEVVRDEPEPEPDVSTGSAMTDTWDAYAPGVFDNASADSTIATTFVGKPADVSVSDSTLDSLRAATAALTDDGVNVAYILLDRDTGLMISYNTTETFYTASSWKANGAAYVLDLVESGQASLDDTLYEQNQVEGGVEAYDGISAYPLESILDDMVRYSDNTAYDTLRTTYDSADLAAWADENGMDGSLAYEDWYPHCTTRDLAQLWLHIATFRCSGTSTAAFATELFQTPEASMLRGALADDGSVLAKAGWIDDWDEVALVEGGMVITDNDEYLIAIMSDDESGLEAGTEGFNGPEGMGDLITALVDVRDTVVGR